MPAVHSLKPTAQRLIERLRLREISVLIALLLVALGTWAFIELADEVRQGETQQVDEWIVRALRQPDDPTRPIGPKWLALSAQDITALGSGSVLALFILAVAGYLLMRRKFHAMWFVLAATVGGEILSHLLKSLFARERPSVVPHLTDVTSASFPSGHSMLSAVVYLTLGALLLRLTKHKRAKVYILAIALMLAFLIGVTRVYLGVHYPTDVLAGWSAGLVWAIACWLTEGWLQKRGAVEPAE